MTRDEAILAQMERELERVVRFTHDIPTGPLFQYTDAAGLLGIIRERELWATHVRHLNDRKELVVGEGIVQAELTALASSVPEGPQRLLFEELAAIHETSSLSKKVDIYVASLTENGDLLSQWRGYGANGAGYSIGFNGFPLPTGDPPNANAALGLMRCEYDEGRFRETVRANLLFIAEAFEKYATTYLKTEDAAKAMTVEALSIALRAVGVLVPRLKHEAFKEEREWRLVMFPKLGHEADVVRFRHGPRGLTAYMAAPLAQDTNKIDIARVYVGPSQDPQAGEATVRMLLDHSGYDGAKLVSLSSAPYRG